MLCAIGFRAVNIYSSKRMGILIELQDFWHASSVQTGAERPQSERATTSIVRQSCRRNHDAGTVESPLVETNSQAEQERWHCACLYLGTLLRSIRLNQLDLPIASGSSLASATLCRLLGHRLLPVLPGLLDRRSSQHPLVPGPTSRVLGLPFLAEKALSAHHVLSLRPRDAFVRETPKNRNSPYRTPPP
jgi:hypothetical protein